VTDLSGFFSKNRFMPILQKSMLTKNPASKNVIPMKCRKMHKELRMLLFPNFPACSVRHLSNFTRKRRKYQNYAVNKMWSMLEYV